MDIQYNRVLDVCGFTRRENHERSVYMRDKKSLKLQKNEILNLNFGRKQL